MKWLKEVDKFALTNAIYNMDSSIRNFLGSMQVIQSLRVNMIIINHIQQIFTNGNITVDFDGNKVKLPKLKGVKANRHRKFSGERKSETISQVPSGEYL